MVQADGRDEHSSDHMGEKRERDAQDEHSSHNKDSKEMEAAEQDALAMTKQEERKILRKIDLNIVPYMSLLYLLSFLDRVNIGQAAVAGLKQDLGIVTGNAYQIALSGGLSFRRIIELEYDADL